MSNLTSKTNTNKELVRCVSQLDSATSFVEIKAVLRNLSDQLEMEYFIYGSQIPVSYVRPITTIVDGYPNAWREHYASSEYLAIDPTVAHCRTSTVPLWWSEVERSEEPVKQFFESAKDHGLKEGVSNPVHGSGREWAMLSFASDRKIGRKRRELLTSISGIYSPFIHEACSRLVQKKYADEQDAENSHKLTAREEEVLLWTAEGKTSQDIAMILNISERTVVFHLQNIGRKLNVSNRTHAVAKAISLGLINPLL